MLNKKIILGFFLSLFAIADSFSQTTTLPPAAQEAINNGIIATKVPDYLLAIKYFEEARKVAPQSAEIFFNLGLAESKIPGRELRAICWFGAYLSANPNAPNAAAVKEQIAVLNIKNQSDITRLLNMVQDAADQIAGKDESRGLSDVVELWVSFGDLPAAIKAVNLINKKDISSKGFALRDIADAQLDANDIAGAQKTTDQITFALFKCSQLLRIAATQLQNGDTSGAQKTLVAAFKTAGRIHADPEFGIQSMESKEREQLYQVAGAHAGANDIAGAQKILTAIKKPDTGSEEYWLYYKIGALSAIFLAEIRAGDIVAAQRTFAISQSEIDISKNGLYKDLAYSIIAKAQAKGGDIAGAQKNAEFILDPEIISLAQSAIASVQAMRGDKSGAQKTLAVARINVELIKSVYSKAGALIAIAEAQIKAGDIVAAKKILAIAQDTADLIQDEFYKSLANRDIAKAKIKAGINDVKISDWLKKLDDSDKINGCPLNTEFFLDLDSHLKSLVRSGDSEEIFKALKQTAEKIVNARNIILKLIEVQSGK